MGLVSLGSPHDQNTSMFWYSKSGPKLKARLHWLKLSSQAKKGLRTPSYYGFFITWVDTGSHGEGETQREEDGHILYKRDTERWIEGWMVDGHRGKDAVVSERKWHRVGVRQGKSYSTIAQELPHWFRHSFLKHKGLVCWLVHFINNVYGGGGVEKVIRQVQHWKYG